MHDLRTLCTDTAEQERPANPQREGTEDTDQAFDKEVRYQSVIAAVHLKPCIYHSKHTKEESGPMQPTLWLSFGRGLTNSFFNFKFNEIACTAPAKEESKPQRGNGGEDGRTHAKGRVNVKVARTEFHEAYG